MSCNSVIAWEDFKAEAKTIADREILLSSFISNTILIHNSFNESIAALLSISFNGLICISTWTEIFKLAFCSKFHIYIYMIAIRIFNISSTSIKWFV